MHIIIFFQLILFYIILLCSISIGKYSRKNDFCISLIIPSTFDDYTRCYTMLKRSLCNSMIYPYEVIIVISGVYNRDLTNVSLFIYELRKCTKELVILYRSNKKNAASNRNFGFYKSRCSIISFFDVDDIMSIYRIEIIHRIFRENRKVDVVFHPFITNYNKLDIYNLSQLYSKYVVINQFSRITERCRKTFSFDKRVYKCDASNNYFIANNCPTIKRNIMNYIKFNESLQSTEDLDFISRVVFQGYNVALFNKPLGFYIKDFDCQL